MLIRTDEKSVTLTPFGSLALNGNASRGGQSWIEIIRTALFKADQKRSDQPINRTGPFCIQTQERIQ